MGEVAPAEPVVAGWVAVVVLVAELEVSPVRAVELVPYGAAAAVAACWGGGTESVAAALGHGAEAEVADVAVVAFAAPFELAASSSSSSQCLQPVAANDVSACWRHYTVQTIWQIGKGILPIASPFEATSSAIPGERSACAAAEDAHLIFSKD